MYVQEDFCPNLSTSAQSTKLAVYAGQDERLCGDTSAQRGLFLCSVVTVCGQHAVAVI